MMNYVTEAYQRDKIKALESQLAEAQERVKELEAEQEASKAFQEDVEATHRITLRDMQRELAALQSRADQDRADAERWRKLLEMHHNDDKQSLCIAWYDSKAERRFSSLAGRDPVAIIDAARATQKESEKEKQNG